MAWVFVIEKAKLRDRAEQLSLGATASRGDPKAIRRTLRDWKRQL